MQLTFLGAAGTVTGSSYALTAQAGDSIMIDCGMFQGLPDLDELNYQPLTFDVSSLNGVILTHAHLDHCGRLPLLLKQGFHKPIWMTPPTLDMTQISLADSAKIHTDKTQQRILYDEEQAELTMKLFQTVEYHQTFTIGSFSIVMRDAGHILGSASLEITDTSATTQLKKIVFSGDLGNTPQEIIQPTELIADSDVVVMESTYGDREHPVEDVNTTIQQEVNAIEKSGDALLIPAFSIERSQELLHRFAHLKKDGKIKPETPIFFDSPMATKVTQVFMNYPEYFNPEFKNEFDQSDPFAFPGLQVVGHREESLKIEETPGPKVIVAGSGMMTGGRILNHAAKFLPIPSTRLLLVGFQGEGTIGRQIAEGAPHVMIQRISVPVKAHVSQTRALSSHADQHRLLNWLQHIQGVKKVFLTHGEEGSRMALAEKIREEQHIENVSLPKLNETLAAS